MAAPMQNSEEFRIGPGINTGGDQPPPQVAAEANYKFTTDELRVLQQCNRESFFQRSLPIGTGLGIATYLGVQSGYMRGHARWGPTPKVILAATVGYFIGKFSYQSKCAEKLMQLENSPLGEMLRKRRQHGRGGFNDAISMDPGFGSGSLPPIAGLGPQDVYSDVGPRHDLDTDRPYQAGLNEDNKPTPDSTYIEEDLLPEHPPSHTTNYEELRRKNREEYEQKRSKQYRAAPGSEEMPPARPRSPDQSNAPPPNWNQEKNKYGDTWEE